MKLTILMPCLNEAETLPACIGKAKDWIRKSGIEAEIVVADNGSNDDSREIAVVAGARVVPVIERGYGAAIRGGAEAARGEWIIVGDADDSYDFGNLDGFVAKLSEGYGLVMGNRFKGGIRDGAMPWKNRWIGNPILSGIGRLLFGAPIRDFHCGLRGFSKKAFLDMDLRTTGMEFASEMVAKAALKGLPMCEVPVTLSKDGRSRPPHLRPWRDGWRHLRFMALLSPAWLFAIPGGVLAAIGSMAWTALMLDPLRIGGIVLDIHTLLFAQAATLAGLSWLLGGLVVRAFGARERLLPDYKPLRFLMEHHLLEAGTAAGALLAVCGLALAFASISAWGLKDFGPLGAGELVRKVSAATMLLGVGAQMVVTSLILGFLTLPVKRGA